MSDPYTPPATQEEHPGTPPSNKHSTLRRIGALGMAIQLGKLLWSVVSNFDQLRGTSVIGVSVGVLFLGTLIYGFLRRGRRFHLTIAVLLGFSIASRAFTLWYITPDQLPGEWNPWLTFAIQIFPAFISFLCATALYLRAIREPSRG